MAEARGNFESIGWLLLDVASILVREGLIWFRDYRAAAAITVTKVTARESVQPLI